MGLQFFYAVAKCKNLNEAAGKTNLSSKVLLANIRKLEETIGFSAFRISLEKEISLTIKEEIILKKMGKQ